MLAHLFFWIFLHYLHLSTTAFTIPVDITETDGNILNTPSFRSVIAAGVTSVQAQYPSARPVGIIAVSPFGPVLSPTSLLNVSVVFSNAPPYTAILLASVKHALAWGQWSPPYLSTRVRPASELDLPNVMRRDLNEVWAIMRGAGFTARIKVLRVVYWRSKPEPWWIFDLDGGGQVSVGDVTGKVQAKGIPVGET